MLLFNETTDDLEDVEDGGEENGSTGSEGDGGTGMEGSTAGLGWDGDDGGGPVTLTPEREEPRGRLHESPIRMPAMWIATGRG